MQWQMVVVPLVVAMFLQSKAWRQGAERSLTAALAPWLAGLGRSGSPALARRVIRRARWELTAASSAWGRLPGEVYVMLAPDDARQLGSVWSEVESALIDEMCAVAERRGWSAPPDMQVMLAEDPNVPDGRPRVQGRFRTRTRGVVDRPATADATTAPQPGGTRKTRPARPTGGGRPSTASCELLSLDGRGPDIPLITAAPMITIGRVGCDVTVRDDVVSALHAELRRAGPQWLIRDCRSANGVELNGRPVDGDAPLLHNDEVTFGRGGPRYVFSRLTPEIPGPARWQ
jgi:hypothetical protein